MAKEWILNSAMNRFQLNFKRNVGATSESIRKCTPKILKEWEKYYFSNVRSKEHIEELGKKLYIKITEVIQAEVEKITEEDCINYMFQMVIERTYDGYNREIKTIYGQLQSILQKIHKNIKIKPAPDKWDRFFNVDFFIKICDNYIGLQIKPVNDGIQLSQIFKEQNIQKNTHKEFKDKFGGKVFYIYSRKNEKKREIANIEIVDNIKQEIERLKELCKNV